MPDETRLENASSVALAEQSDLAKAVIAPTFMAGVASQMAALSSVQMSAAQLALTKSVIAPGLMAGDESEMAKFGVIANQITAYQALTKSVIAPTFMAGVAGPRLVLSTSTRSVRREQPTPVPATDQRRPSGGVLDDPISAAEAFLRRLDATPHLDSVMSAASELQKGLPPVRLTRNLGTFRPQEGSSRARWSRMPALTTRVLAPVNRCIQNHGIRPL